VTGQIVHFELPAGDTARARTFWSELFGWTFRSWDGPVEYHMTGAGGPPEGAIFPAQDDERGPLVYFDVDEMGPSVDRVRDLGGEAEDAQPIQGIGWFARCRDTEGNRFSLFQSDDSVEAR
jgi:hypothetical protein